MRHLTATHSGREIDEPMRITLRAMQRAICVDPSCGGLRPIGQRTCNRCRQTSHCRPPVVGDIIAGSTSVPQPQEADSPAGEPASTMSDNTQSNENRDSEPVQGPITLPDDFSMRVRRLSHNSCVHIPLSCRLRLVRITRQCWNRCADGSTAWALLEEGRTKLILGSIPEGMAVAEEVKERIAMWEGGNFANLLNRAEQQRIAGLQPSLTLARRLRVRNTWRQRRLTERRCSH